MNNGTQFSITECVASQHPERPLGRLANLPALAQVVVGKHDGHHGFTHRHGTNADAGVVAAFGAQVRLGAEAGHGGALAEDRGGRLDGKAADQRLAGRDAAEDTAGMVREESRPAIIARPHLVGILFAGQGCCGEAVTDLDTLNNALGTSEYLLPSGPTLADISCSAYLCWLEQAGISSAGFPHVARWLSSLQQLPGWEHPDTALQPRRTIEA